MKSGAARASGNDEHADEHSPSRGPYPDYGTSSEPRSAAATIVSRFLPDDPHGGSATAGRGRVASRTLRAVTEAKADPRTSHAWTNRKGDRAADGNQRPHGSCVREGPSQALSCKQSLPPRRTL